MITQHANSEAHKKSCSRAQSFLDICNGKARTIAESLMHASEKDISRQTNILLEIIDAVVSLCRRNIALRGTWDKEKRQEESSFNFFLQWKASEDLKTHFDYAPKNAKYASPKEQNIIIHCCEDEIRSTLVSDCFNAEFFFSPS